MAKFRRKRTGKHSINPAKSFDFIKDTLDEIGSWHTKRRYQITSPWDGEPVFTSSVRKTTKGWMLSIFMTGEHGIKWSVMDKGDASRLIDAGGKDMVYLQGYTSSTEVGSLSTGEKERFGRVTKARAVMHEVKPRGINDIINELSRNVERRAFAKRGPKL